MKVYVQKFAAFFAMLVLVGTMLCSSGPSALAYIYSPDLNAWTSLNATLSDYLGVDVSGFSDALILPRTGECTPNQLQEAKNYYNGWVSRLARWANYNPVLGITHRATITDIPSEGISRLVDAVTGKFVVDSQGRFPYCYMSGDVPEEPGQAPAADIAPPSISRNTFLDVRSLKTNVYNVVTYDALSTAVMNINNDGTSCDLRPFGNYYAIWNGDYKVYCNSSGQAYVALKDQSATDIKYDYIDNSTNTVIKDSQILDIENGLFTYIDDSGEKVTLTIDSLYYDASTHTYNTTVYDQVFNVTNNYYEYNYYTYNITYNYQYTYVTYIGSTAEYKKDFEYYYELDDGRSSADLTAEDLAGLSIGFDVVNYDRVATDTHTQALYHFDGNWNDSSYYSNQTKLNWLSGASITYLDSNVFGGCLFLDNLSHSFSIYPPLKQFFASDFTVQFRFYAGAGSASTNLVSNSYNGYSSIGSCYSIGASSPLFAWNSTGFYLYGSFAYSFNSEPGPLGYYRIAQVPVGSWVDISFEVSNGSLLVFINGVMYDYGPRHLISKDCVFSPIKYTAYPYLQFSYAADVFSYSYLDELRLVDFAVYTSKYQPSPVPFDTNNVFVLPATENLKELTIAVQHDTPVNGFRVGGVRPTFPAKGLVWFPVEKSRITDCQIYNGSYWESVECRLWTGVRWIPLWAFDVFTLADCFDIADSGVLPSITTEIGFWSWWQKEWTSFRKWLTENGGGIIGGGSGSGSSFWDKIKDALTNGIATLVETLFDLISTVLKTLLSVVANLLSSVFDFLTDTVLASITGFFASFKDMAFFEFFIQAPASEPDPETGEVVPPVVGLPSDVTTVFAFFSGIIMLLPVELRALLFFGIAALILISVFKLVKS